jgi:hypothetical protein
MDRLEPPDLGVSVAALDPLGSHLGIRGLGQHYVRRTEHDDSRSLLSAELNQYQP